MIRVVTLRQFSDEDAGTLWSWQKVNKAAAEVTPGLLDVEVNKVSSTPVGAKDVYGLMVKLTFVDMASFEQAQQSESGRDMLGFTKGLVTMLVIEKTDFWAEPLEVPPSLYFGG